MRVRANNLLFATASLRSSSWQRSHLFAPFPGWFHPERLVQPDTVAGIHLGIDRIQFRPITWHHPAPRPAKRLRLAESQRPGIRRRSRQPCPWLSGFFSNRMGNSEQWNKESPQGTPVSQEASKRVMASIRKPPEILHVYGFSLWLRHEAMLDVNFASTLAELRWWGPISGWVRTGSCLLLPEVTSPPPGNC